MTKEKVHDFFTPFSSWLCSEAFCQVYELFSSKCVFVREDDQLDNSIYSSCISHSKLWAHWPEGIQRPWKSTTCTTGGWSGSKVALHCLFMPVSMCRAVSYFPAPWNAGVTPLDNPTSLSFPLSVALLSLFLTLDPVWTLQQSRKESLSRS